MAQAEPDPIKLVVYDFDQTISSDHIYHKLDGMAKSRSGNGQLDELKSMPLNELYKTFGGKDRISRLDLHFKRVRSSADVAIVSYGYVSVIRKTLEIVKLSEYFENMVIIGCDSAQLKQVHGNKAQCIQGMKKQRNLKSDQVLFVDDDSSNIRRAKNINACKTMEIKPRNGMTDSHMEEIEKIIGVFEIEKKEMNNNNNNKKGNENNENAANNESGNSNSSENNNSTDNSNPNNPNNLNDNNNNKNSNNNNDNSNNNGNNIDNIDNNNNNNNNNSNNNNKKSSTDDSKEATTNRQPSWKDKLQNFVIDDDKNKLLDKLLSNGNEDSEGTPVVDVPHESDSETNDNGDNIVLTTPIFTQKE